MRSASSGSLSGQPKIDRDGEHVTRSVVVAARVVIGACLILGAYQCLVFARAAIFYQQDTATSIPAALALVPFDGAYVARLATWQPARKEELLSQAVALNPFDVDSWIQLALTAELQNGDARAAERYYLRAAEVDKMFRPRWALTNFYFRQQRLNEFFHWARATLEITPYPAAPVFAQMWLVTQNQERLSEVIPDRPGILLQYVLYLQKESQFDAIPSIVKRLTTNVDAERASAYGRDDVIGPMEDRLILAGHFDAAFQVWNILCGTHWLPYAAPTNASPLTNGDFRKPVFGKGFDWAVVNVNGSAVDQDSEHSLVRISFNGDQPDHTPLLRQFVPLRPGGNYRLDWSTESEGMASPSGLSWHLYSVGGGASQDLRSGDVLASSSGKWTFKANAATDCGILMLAYTRPLGSTRATGTVRLRTVSLKEEDATHEKK